MAEWMPSPPVTPDVSDHESSHTVFTQVFSNYGRAVIAWTRALRWRNRPVFCVFATPERAFSQAQRIVDDANTHSPKVLPLLFASVEHTGIKFDPSRFVEAQEPARYSNAAVTRYYGYRRPNPYTFNYSVNVWARNRFDLDWIFQQVATGMRHQEFYLSVDHPFPMGTKKCLSRLTEVRDLPIVDDPESQRKLRRVFVLEVGGWMQYPTAEYGIVEQVIADLYDSPTLDVDDPDNVYLGTETYPED